MTRKTTWLPLLGAFILCATPVFAADLTSYRERLDRAAAYSAELTALIASGPVELERGSIASLRGLLPVSEMVETPSGSLEVDNRWLHTRLDDLDRETDLQKRQAIAAGMSERLAAIGRGVRELEAAAAADRSKDEDKQKLAEILRRPEYQKAEPQEESLVQRWWRAFLEWLASVFPSPSISPATATDYSSLRTIVQVVVFVLLLALAAFLVWRLLPLFSDRLDGRKRKAKTDRVILGELISADRSATDLLGEAEALAREGDLRGAIRKGYVALLCELGDRKVVRLARHKTNRDYLADVRRHDRLADPFKGMTLQFEHVWYGSRVAEQADWEQFYSLYRQALSER